MGGDVLTDGMKQMGLPQTNSAVKKERVVGFAGSLGNVERVDVLPFHQMGRFKWKELGLTYTLDDIDPPSADLVQRVVAQFRAAGVNAY